MLFASSVALPSGFVKIVSKWTELADLSSGKASWIARTASRLPSQARATLAKSAAPAPFGTTSTGRPHRRTTEWAIGSG
jgi:hypothetical protein